MRPGSSSPATARARRRPDDRLVIDRWDVHGSIVDDAPIRGGRRKLRVEYFERTGWAELRVEVVNNLRD